MAFSEKLLQLRKQKGLAEQLQVSRQAVSRWEMGSAMPDVVNLTRIAKLFAISLDELVNEKGQANKIPEETTVPAAVHDKRHLVAAICFYFSAFCFMVSYEKQEQMRMLGLGIVLLVPGSVLLYRFLKGGTIFCRMFLHFAQDKKKKTLMCLGDRPVRSFAYWFPAGWHRLPLW